MAASKMSSRSALFLAMVAALCSSALAHRGLLASDEKKSSCAKNYPGCSSGCVFDDLDVIEDCTCKDDNAVFVPEEEECLCDWESGYGRLSKSQYKDFKGDNKGDKDGEYENAKHGGRKGCVLCADFELDALDDGNCGLLQEP
jgi:hypothetical protein